MLRLAHGQNLIENLEQTLAQLQQEVGEPILILGCDCILRRLEMERNGIIAEIEMLYLKNHMVGFNSYGEQFRGIHANQTLTGTMIGKGRKET